jgi:hypothetical protein
MEREKLCDGFKPTILKTSSMDKVEKLRIPDVKIKNVSVTKKDEHSHTLLFRHPP